MSREEHGMNWYTFWRKILAAHGREMAGEWIIAGNNCHRVGFGPFALTNPQNDNHPESTQ